MARQNRPQQQRQTSGGGGKFRLLAGGHIQNDVEKLRVLDAQRAAGEVSKEDYPVLKAGLDRVYQVGEIVVSDTDLAARFGREKFARVGGEEDPGPDAFGDHNEQWATAPAVQTAAPNGQVSSGFQASTSAPNRGTVAGPLGAPVGPLPPVLGPLTAQPEPPKSRTFGEAGEPAPSQAGQQTPGHPDHGSRQAAPDLSSRQPAKPDFDSMTVEELREHAHEAGINLHGAKTKDEVLKTVKKEAKGR